MFKEIQKIIASSGMYGGEVRLILKTKNSNLQIKMQVSYISLEQSNLVIHADGALLKCCPQRVTVTDHIVKVVAENGLEIRLIFPCADDEKLIKYLKTDIGEFNHFLMQGDKCDDRK